jgi:hypothetical protein
MWSTLTFCQFFFSRAEMRVGKRGCKWNRKVHTKHDVGEHLVVCHLDVANGDTETQNLLQLKLDGRADFVQFARQVLGMRDGGRELASCTQMSVIRTK